jgi:hypothetical protein
MNKWLGKQTDEEREIKSVFDVRRGWKEVKLGTIRDLSVG